MKASEGRARGIVPSQIPPPHIVQQHSSVGCPPQYLRPRPLQCNRCTQRNTAQMKEEIKAPEKQLSNEEIASLSDTEFKTLVIRMFKERVEYGHKIEEEV